MGNDPGQLQHACIKSLSKSELFDQREFNGVKALKIIFGENNKSVSAVFSVRGTSLLADVGLTWYNSREKDVSRNEFRLYYEPNLVMAQAMPGDNIVIGYDENGNLNCILFRNNSSEHQGVINNWVPYS